MFNCDYQSGYKINTQWKYSAAHFREVFSNKGKNRFNHIILGILDAIPLIGLASSILEKKVINSNVEYNLKNREFYLSNELKRTSFMIQRVYFETQSGTSRKGQFNAIPILDGAHNDLMLVNLENNLREFKNGLSPDELQEHADTIEHIEEQLEKAKPLFLSIGLMVMEKNKKKKEVFLEKISNDISTIVKNMEVGESQLLPGGYTNIQPYALDSNSNGHVMLYELTKQPDGQFSFRIFNSGEGNDKHAKEGLKYRNAIIYDIPQENLTPSFFYDLSNFANGEILYEDKGTHTAKFTINDLYDYLTENLGDLEADRDGGIHYDQGIIGNCAHQCLMYWLKDNMSNELYTKYTAYTTDNLIKKFNHWMATSVKKKDVKIEHSILRMGYAKNKMAPKLFTFIISFFTGDRVRFKISNNDLSYLQTKANEVKNKRNNRL